MASMEARFELADQIGRVADLLRAELSRSAADPVHSLATARSLDQLTDEALQLLVSAARERGVPWARIGAALGTTRQAAFQRFGSPVDPRTGAPMERITLPGAAEKATAIFTSIAESRWDAAAEGFSPAVRKALGPTGLADAYANTVSLAGNLQSQGPPHTLAMAGVTVVEVPLHHEAADLRGRVSFAGDGSVVGLWFLPASASLADREPEGSPR